MTLDDVIARLRALPEAQRKEAVTAANAVTAGMKWVPNPGPQEKCFFSPADETFYGGQAGGGKGQPMDGLVLTPFGYRKMADIRVGSAVCSPDGTVSQVIGVYPLGVRQLYRVAFHDGTSVEVTGDHIWLAWRSGQYRKKASALVGGESSARLWTTEQLIAGMGKDRFRIPVTEPVLLTDQARYPRRPVDAYALGVLLGDGSITERALRITTMDPEIAAKIAANIGVELLGPYNYGTKTAEYRIPFSMDWLKHFKKWGLLGCGSADKFIPPAYLLGTVSERWALLQGLMDTDGWAEADGDIYFTSVSKKLADGVADLARSLGAVVTWRDRIPTFTDTAGNKQKGQRAYSLRLKFRDGSQAFALERKRDKVKRGPQSMGKVIVSIEPTRMADSQCIKVSHSSSLYIADGYTVTHNTDLAVGLALTAHRRSLLLRRINKDAVKIVSRIEEIMGTRDGYNGQLQRWRVGDKQIDIAGCEQESDKQRFKGDPHDLIIFDEGTDFLESQYRFIIGWNRSAIPTQRCRVLVTSNPPTTADGLWVIKYWAPWLDPNHPNPANPGELRWFTTIGGNDVEVDGRGPHLINGEMIEARSRTFIPAKLSDNPDLAATNYASVLASLPQELRRAYRDGDFSVGLKDAEFQVIPTEWILAAQARWTPRPPVNIAMTAMGFDPAGGGNDVAALAYRYGGYYAEIVTKGGEETADGSRMAALVMVHRRDTCPVVVDMGGGFGGAVTQRMRDNGAAFIGFNGANKSTANSVGASKLSFYNKRAEAWWRFREALDPDQDGGSAVCLPPDAELRAELAAPTWELKPNGILIESKDELRKRLGRSTNKADAVVMALSVGDAAVKRLLSTRNDTPSAANVGHTAVKKMYARR